MSELNTGSIKKKIKLYDNPFVLSSVKEFECENIAEWLLEHYGANPNINIQVFEGEPSEESEITNDIELLILSNSDSYTVLESPGGEALLIKIAVVIILQLVASLLAPSPSLPSNVNRTQDSPNNALGSRENQVRVGQRVEDIYGKVKSIPSLMMQTYNKYIDNLKYEYGYYCVGRGYYDVTDIRDGDTLISDITGSSAAVFNPFTSPNSGDAPIIQIGATIADDIVSVKRAVEVDGVTLKAPNQLNLPSSANYDFIPDVAGDKIVQRSPTPNLNSIAEVGDSIGVSMSAYTVASTPEIVSAQSADNSFLAYTDAPFSNIFVGDTVTVDFFTISGNNGVCTVVSKPSNNKIIVTGLSLTDETSLDPVFYVNRNYTGTYVIDSIQNGQVTLTTSNFKSQILNFPCSVSLPNVDGYTSWVTLPQPDRDRVWVNVLATLGMYKDNGGKSSASVDFEVQVEKLNSSLVPLGVVETYTGSISGDTADERGVTLEHTTAWTGPARVRLKRTTDFDFGFTGTVVDEIKWGDLYGVSPTAKTNFGNKTTIHTVTKATARATSVKQRQLNCIAHRKLPTYNGSTFSGAFNSDGLLVSGVISPTSKVVDILAAVSVDPKIGQRNLTLDVDINQIYSVQQALDAWDSEVGQFNYTIDSDNISYEEIVTIIANAAFCTAYRQNGKIRFALDNRQDNSVALFTHRNKKPDGENITRAFSTDSQYDGVEFVYNDFSSNTSETIILPLDGSATKLKKFEIPGIRSFRQAWFRANREYYKILGQRVFIETSTTMDARSLLPNSRIDIVDNTRFKSYDGEVLAQDGLTLTLSQSVRFTPSSSHSIVLIKRDGGVQSIVCTAGPKSNQVVLASVPTEAIVTNYGQEGIRTIFSFASDSARAAQAYLVQEIDMSDPEYPLIKAVNYSHNYYQKDTQSVPDRDSIIND